MDLKRFAKGVTAAILGITLCVAVPAQAEPGGQPLSWCSAWEQFRDFVNWVCATSDRSSANIRYDHYVKYIGAGTAVATAYNYYRIGPEQGYCTLPVPWPYATDQIRTFTCYTDRVPGYVYRTVGRIHLPIYDKCGDNATSPTVTAEVTNGD